MRSRYSGHTGLLYERTTKVCSDCALSFPVALSLSCSRWPTPRHATVTTRLFSRVRSLLFLSRFFLPRFSRAYSVVGGGQGLLCPGFTVECTRTVTKVSPSPSLSRCLALSPSPTLFLSLVFAFLARAAYKLNAVLGKSCALGSWILRDASFQKV